MFSLSRRFVKNQSGQAITEYILLLIVVMMLGFVVREVLRKFKIADQLAKPINKKFAYIYRYGHVDTRGPEDGGYKKHPRAVGSEGNFRLFLNPGRR